MSEPFKKVIMTGYDAMKQEASFAFLDRKAKNNDIRLHKTLFRSLMEEKWDADKLGECPEQLDDFKRALSEEVKDNYFKWFEETANEILKQELTGAKKQ